MVSGPWLASVTQGNRFRMVQVAGVVVSFAEWRTCSKVL